jgi:general secretion pathway protein M
MGIERDSLTMNPQTIQRWWRQRATREQRLLGAAATLLVLALLWVLALAPALKTLRQHDARAAQLQATLSHMQGLEAQAKLLQGRSSMGGAAAQQALQTHTVSLLGKQADIAARNGGASVTLRSVSPQALGRWLATVRTEAHVQVLQSRLQRGAEGWSGSLQLRLPE